MRIRRAGACALARSHGLGGHAGALGLTATSDLARLGDCGRLARLARHRSQVRLFSVPIDVGPDELGNREIVEALLDLLDDVEAFNNLTCKVQRDEYLRERLKVAL